LQKNISENWKTLDGIVFNVGKGDWQQESFPTKEKFLEVLNVNFFSAYETFQIFEKSLVKSSSACVFVSSIAGLEDLGAPFSYAASKSALNVFVKSLAHKFSEFGIRANCIAPGNILFPGGSWDKKIQDKGIEFKNSVTQKVPLSRFGTPEEIANVIAFLLSPKSSFVNGAIVCADGGQCVGF
jgi:3-oxoacyl-[acyl-carrier protein] reductase